MLFQVTDSQHCTDQNTCNTFAKIIKKHKENFYGISFDICSYSQKGSKFLKCCLMRITAFADTFLYPHVFQVVLQLLRKNRYVSFSVKAVEPFQKKQKLPKTFIDIVHAQDSRF